MPWSSVKLLGFVLFTVLGAPGLVYLALALLIAPFGATSSGRLTFPLVAGVAFVAAVAWIFVIDRRGSRRGNNPIDAGCLLILIGVAILSGLSIVLSLCKF